MEAAARFIKKVLLTTNTACVDIESLFRMHAIEEDLDARINERACEERGSVSWSVMRQRLMRSLPSSSHPYFGYINIERFEDLPTTSKDCLRTKTADFLLVEDEKNIWTRESSGTTGKPITVFFNANHYYDQLVLSPEFIARRALGYEHVIRPFFLIYLTNNADSVCELTPDPWGGGVLQYVVDENALTPAIQTILALKPDALSVRPSILEALLAAPECPNLLGITKLVIVSGANLTPGVEVAASHQLGIPVVNAYGLTEFGIVASECVERNGLHVDGDVIIETLHSDGSIISGEGIGEIALSSLRNSVMPLVRYRTGDIGSISLTQCKCGRSTPRIKRVHGRTLSSFRLASGTLISPTRFDKLFEVDGIRDFQMIQTSPNSFHLIVEPLPNSILRESDISRFVTNRFPEAIELSIETRCMPSDKDKFQRYRRHGE